MVIISFLELTRTSEDGTMSVTSQEIKAEVKEDCKPGRNWFCFHWGWALIEHFPRDLGLGKAVWVPAHYIFFKWLALQLPLQLLLYFVAATWELCNNPEPKATILLRTSHQYYRIFDIIAVHITLQGDIYTD